MDADVLVLGGGVGGITAALEIAEKGFTVCLVEKEPSIGGRMAQLDKTFPTLDCSICILGPKMVEASMHPNIKLLAYSEVKEVKRDNEGYRFTVKIVKKPRYVDENKCTGCRRCEEKCPVKVASEFNEGIGLRKAIYIPFPQAVPRVATIDRERCLYFTKGICRVCEKICPSEAVNFEQEPEEITLNVHSIIISTGFNLLDPSILPQYGYGRYPDVLTSLQYERLMNAAGPTGGEIVRPSDRKHPKRIAIIQCVGSRNVKVKDYCSQICCMYATKQAIVTKEHDPNIDVVIFYKDINASGKGHEELVRRAVEEYGVKYIKGLPSEVLWDDKNGKLFIRYMDLPSGEMKWLDIDLVVLSPAVTPRDDLKKIAETFGLELNEYGFIRSIDETLVNTNIPGIYVCGACEGPKDISHTVMQALAAAAQASERILSLRKEKILIRSQPVVNAIEETGGEPRIGIFVCHCGLNIAAVVDVKEVVRDVANIPDVVYATDLTFACSKDGVEAIKEAIKKQNLNRVIVASCTPSTHEPLFRKICEEAGLNPYLFEMVNIREHVSWVHRTYPRIATDKAKELIRMAVARARLLQPLRRTEVEVTPSTLIIGGSISGLVAAKTLSKAGFKVYLVESGDKLGNDLDFYRYDNTEAKWISELINSINYDRNIEVYLSSKIEEVKGSIGEFKVKIIRDGNIEDVTIGTIIVALTPEEFKPDGIYGHGRNRNIITIPELRRGSHIINNGENMAFILCAGARERSGRVFCSAICCEEALKEMIEIKEKNPEVNIYALYRDLRLPLNGEKLYRQAREAGIEFIRYDIDRPLEISEKDGTLLLNVYESSSNIEFEIPIDKVILATPILPSRENRELSSILKVPLNIYGFYLEAHPKLRPLDFSVDGIYLCGASYYPQRLHESVLQGLGAASRALTPMIRGKVSVEPVIAQVEQNLCTGCGRCHDVCEFGAIKLEVASEDRLIAIVDPKLCKGCGSCSVECPAKAITIHHFRDNQILAMIEAAFEKPSPRDRPKILAFFCNWCGYAAADMAGISRYEYPPTVEIIRVMCSARVDILHVLYALLRGADGVLIVGCHPGDCHYISGNLKAKERVMKVKELIESVGIPSNRVRIDWASAGEGLRLSKIIKEFTDEIEVIGYNPLRRCG